MPPVKPKPPTETKAQLMEEVADALQNRYPHDPRTAILFLTNFFTAVDLVGIRQELKNG